MKTTVGISDSLLDKAPKLAAREQHDFRDAAWEQLRDAAYRSRAA
jgi:hypothetical protein